MLENHERDEFLGCVCAELGIDSRQIKQVGIGYDGQIYKISEHLCLKIGKNGHEIAVPEALRNCENLAIPKKTFLSPSKAYKATIQPLLNLGSIQRFIKRGIILPENQTRDIARGLLNGLRQLHETGYVHRDMYPGNIMLTSYRGLIRTVIVDFDEMRQITPQTRALFRFNGYHEPNVVFHDEVYDDKSEMFAAGIILWELFLGRCPFAGYYLFGRVIEDSWEDYQQNKERCHHQVEEALRRAPIEIEKISHISDNRGDLLSLLLNLQREKRITAAQALQHPYFQNK